MTTHRILVHGHRGARARHPENTLTAFRYAIDIGADALEMDIGVTQDNILIVNHDPDLNGVLIRSLPLTEIGQRAPAIPSLDEVLNLAPGSQVHFNIEIKSFPDHPDYTPPPAVFAKMLVKLIHRHNLESRVIVQSFDFRTLHEMKKLAPDIRRAALWEGEPRSFVDIATEAGASIVAPEFTLVTPEEVHAAHAAGLLVIPWTANTPSDWDRLIAARVDAIITDDPAALLEFLRGRSLH